MIGVALGDILKGKEKGSAEREVENRRLSFLAEGGSKGGDTFSSDAKAMEDRAAWDAGCRVCGGQFRFPEDVGSGRRKPGFSLLPQAKPFCI